MKYRNGVIYMEKIFHKLKNIYKPRVFHRFNDVNINGKIYRVEIYQEDDFIAGYCYEHLGEGKYNAYPDITLDVRGIHLGVYVTYIKDTNQCLCFDTKESSLALGLVDDEFVRLLRGEFADQTTVSS